MAPKRSSPLDETPLAESSAEEETSSGEDGSSSSSEEIRTLKPKKPDIHKKPAVKNPELPLISQPRQSSSAETGSASDFDMVKTPKVKTSKPSASATHSKRTKKNSEADVEDVVVAAVDESKKLFQRLWSEDDEIVILNGMIDYATAKGSDPALDRNAFYDFIKKSIHVDVTKAQLDDKIRRLKKKYRNNAGRGKKGADPTFSRHHEQKCFELSKKVWGGGGIAPTPKTIQRGSKMKVDDNQAPSSLGGFVAFETSLGAVGFPESFLKPGLELIGQSKRAELEEEWKKLHVSELQLFLKRTQLIMDQANLILEAYK